MFPDGREIWTVAEILTTARQVYSDPDDLPWNSAKIYRAVVVLRQRCIDFPNLPPFEELPSSQGYRYPPASCRLIVREVINGTLPKKFQSLQGESETKSQTDS